MKPNWCKHFNGLQNSKCGKGLDYLELAKPLTGGQKKRHRDNYPGLRIEDTAIRERVPCNLHNNHFSCVGFELPTKQEIIECEEKENDFVAQFLKRLAIVRPVIEADIALRNAEKRTISGIIDCPVCNDKKGKVRYSYAGDYNGHITAQCTTKDCIQWIE